VRFYLEVNENPVNRTERWKWDSIVTGGVGNDDNNTAADWQDIQLRTWKI
jgi:hypothetical protein